MSKQYISYMTEPSRGGPKGFLFNSFYTELLGWALLSLDCSIYPWPVPYNAKR